MLHSTTKAKCLIRFVIERIRIAKELTYHIFCTNNSRIVILVTNSSLYNRYHLLFKIYVKKSIIFIFVIFLPRFSRKYFVSKEEPKYIVWKWTLVFFDVLTKIWFQNIEEIFIKCLLYAKCSKFYIYINNCMTRHYCYPPIYLEGNWGIEELNKFCNYAACKWWTRM